ncbi:MAG TPA: hypothetical protein VGO03_18640 [Acidimicrobiia bacterium]|jgi:hypothetical protein
MQRRARLITGVLAATVLCLGSYTIASAALQPAALTATQPISACADGTGHLRLPTTANKCASGTVGISLARASNAPQALALYTTSGPEVSKTLSLIANTKLVAQCGAGGNEAVGQIEVVHGGQTQIDGTSFVGENGGGDVLFVRNGGPASTSPVGASSVYATSAGGFSAEAGDSGEFATVNYHLLVTVPGAVFTIDGVIDANGPNTYCRISAEVESAATT